jgi:type VI secretion system protein ImpM
VSVETVEAGAPARAVLGFYGKVPSRGDFVQARLTADFVASWDSWIQQLLMLGQQKLGEKWQSSYLEMPIWHYAFAAGVCGAAPCVGILVTSVDSAGRFFPLTLAIHFAGLLNGGGVPLLALDRSDIAYGLEDLALSVLQPGARFEDFVSATESFSLPTGCRVLTTSAEPDTANAMVQSVVRKHLLSLSENWEGRSLWWTQFGPDTRLMSEQGLPRPEAFATMMLGPTDDAVRDEVALSSIDKKPTDVESAGEEPRQSTRDESATVNDQVHVIVEGELSGT